VADRRLVVFGHPDGTRDSWFQSYSMWNSVGQPIEEAKFIAALIYAGVLESFPGVRIVMAHGGGQLPQYYGRLDRNVHAHPQSAVNLSRTASSYLRDLYCDTYLYEPAMLDPLVASGGGPPSDGQRLPPRRSGSGRVRGAGPVAGGPTTAAVLGGTLANPLGLTATSGAPGAVPSSDGA
jgi:hypothetical protein